jgi:hypothetical protein
MIRVLPCKHHFHKECIDAWFKSRLSSERSVCPLCKGDALGVGNPEPEPPMPLNEFLTATAEILYGEADDGAGRVEPSAAVESTPMEPTETQLLLVAVSDSEADRSLEMEIIDGDRSDISSTEGGSRGSSRTAVTAVGANGAGAAGAGAASD